MDLQKEEMVGRMNTKSEVKKEKREEEKGEGLS